MSRHIKHVNSPSPQNPNFRIIPIICGNWTLKSIGFVLSISSFFCVTYTNYSLCDRNSNHDVINQYNALDKHAHAHSYQFNINPFIFFICHRNPFLCGIVNIRYFKHIIINGGKGERYGSQFSSLKTMRTPRHTKPSQAKPNRN